MMSINNIVMIISGDVVMGSIQSTNNSAHRKVTYYCETSRLILAEEQ